MGCVYLVTNTENFDQYIGFTSKTIEQRRRNHLIEAGRGVKRHFYHALRKYGANVFDWRILFKSDDIDTLKAKEVDYIALCSPAYNMTQGGDGVVGRPLSKEHRMKIANSQIGNPLCEEGHRKQAEAMRGKTFSEEHRKHISESNKGKHSGKHTGGWIVSEERRRRISEKLTGIPLSEETKRKISEAKSGKKRVPLSDETKRKISESLIKRHQYKGKATQ